MTFPRLLLAFALLAAPAASFAQEAGEGASADMPADAPKKKAPPKKKPKTYDYEKSRYKSRDLAEGEIKTFRFNSKGEPVQPKAKGKTAADKKKRSEPPEEKPVERGCSEEKPCAPPDEADAL